MSTINHDGGDDTAPPGEFTEAIDLSPATIEKIARRVVDRLRCDLTCSTAGTVLPKLLTPKETADALGISERQLQILSQQDGLLRPVRISKRSVRYPVEQVSAFVRACAGKKERSR